MTVDAEDLLCALIAVVAVDRIVFALRANDLDVEKVGAELVAADVLEADGPDRNILVAVVVAGRCRIELGAREFIGGAVIGEKIGIAPVRSRRKRGSEAQRERRD